jgi:hypothetical protein
MLEIADKVVDGIKAIREIAKRIENAELQSHIADLMMSSADLKMEVAELKSNILQLREENAAVKKRAELRARMRVENGLLVPIEEIPGYGRGPFCPVCFEKEGYLIAPQISGVDRRFCFNCKQDVGFV